MDFKEFIFGVNDMEHMWHFVQKHWDRIFNVEYIDYPEPGDITGWHVRVCRKSVNEKVSDGL